MSTNSTDARITLYNITEIGLYERGGDNSVLGDLSIFLQDLEKWVRFNDKPLRETCTYASLEDEELNKTFCYDIKKGINGNYLLITWNKVASSTNGVSTISGSAKVGEANIQVNNYNADEIPGYPTYFWIMPKENRFATLNFDYAFNGRLDLHKYLREFFGKWSRYVVSDLDEEGIRQIQHWEDPSDSSTIYSHLYGKFDSRLIVNPGKIQYLLNNWKEIRKVHQHNEMSIGDIINVPKIAKIGRMLGLNSAPSKKSGIKFKLEVPVVFNSKEDVQKLIDDWEKNNKTMTKWEDLGFSFQGDTQKIIWLSESRANSYFDCPLIKGKNQVFKSNELVEWLDKITTDILKLENKTLND